MGRPTGRPISVIGMRQARLLATRALLVAIAFAALSSGYGGARPAGAQETVAVTLGDFFFCDPSLAPGACQTVVSAGDTVIWEYRTGSEGHTVTHCGDSCDAPTDTPLWDSGGLSAGQTFSYTFAAPGTYHYYCRFHPEAMRAVVLVEARPAATPTQPVGSSTSPPTGQGSPTPTPSLGVEEDDGGVASWVLVLAGVGGGIVVLGAGVLALRRFR